MNQNNTGHANRLPNDPPRVTTEKGANRPNEPSGINTPSTPRIPGISGRFVAWALGSFMAFSLITIPIGLFVYQGVSDREKSIEKDWPVVAAKLDSFYASCEQILVSYPDNPELIELHSRWKSTQNDFRSRRVWHEQLQVAQNLEDLLRTQTATSGNTQLLDFLRSVSATLEEREGLENARSVATKSYRSLEAEQIAPYKTKLSKFPGNAVLLFFTLPDPPLLRFTESSPSN